MNIPHQVAFDIDLNLDPAWCNWFVGWIDGEGSFGGEIDKNTRSVQAVLSVAVRDDDAQLLCNVADILHCGSIRFAAARGNSNSEVRWRCKAISACRNILVPLFDQYPLHSKKRRDYEIWRELVIAISGGHYLNGNRAHVLDLCQQLKDIKKYVPPTL